MYIKGKCEKYGEIEDYGVHIGLKNKYPTHNGDKIIIKDKCITIEYSHPLKQKFTFHYVSKSEEGFTTKEILNHMIKTYKYMYEQELKIAPKLTYNLGKKKSGKVIPDELRKP